MTLYTRHQLVILLVLLAAAGLGLAVGHWRRARPDLVERVEQFDRRPAPAPAATPPAARRDTSRAERPPAPAPSARARKAEPTPVDLNHAHAAELTRLPGVGPALAAKIIEARDQGGPFATADDLRRVRGLGRAKIERLKALLRID
jgi:competence ComEA-like helix-hairpin-helix protein